MGVLKLTKAQATTYSPSGVTDQNVLPARFANFPFTYVHYPNGWRYHAEHGFLPTLNQVVHEPGINGVEQPRIGTALGQIRVNRAYGGSTAKGGTLIRLDDNRIVGSEWENFIIGLSCQGGGHYWCFMATQFVSYGPGMVEEQDTSDEWWRFCAFLRDKRIVSPMALPVYNRLIRMAEDEKDRLYGKDKTPMVEDRLKAVIAKIDAMASNWAALNLQWSSPAAASPGGPAPKPGKLKLSHKSAPPTPKLEDNA